ncbi:MAG: antirestriction protein ArdA [Phycisphaerales bacterium]|nr:antirestriction protein ArdA [Phycisphaerales bacterium]
MEMNITKDEKITATSPQIYVASLADYNSGRLHGRWIAADQSAHVIREQIGQMLAESKEPIAEEWAIHDYANFAGLSLSEYEDLDKVAELAFLITQHGPLFAALASHFGGTSGIADARRYMEEGYQGEYDSLEDYAHELTEECCGDVLKTLPDFIRHNIDWEAIAHDMDLNGDVITFEIDGRTHVFNAHI